MLHFVIHCTVVNGPRFKAFASKREPEVRSVHAGYRHIDIINLPVNV